MIDDTDYSEYVTESGELFLNNPVETDLNFDKDNAGLKLIQSDPEYKSLMDAAENQYNKAAVLGKTLMIYMRDMDFEPLTIVDDVLRIALESFKEYGDKQRELWSAGRERARELLKSIDENTTNV